MRTLFPGDGVVSSPIIGNASHLVEPLLVMLDHKHPKPLDRGKLDIAVEARSVEQFLLRLRYHMVDANRGALVPVWRTADERNIHVVFNTLVMNNVFVRILEIIKRNIRDTTFRQYISLQLWIILIGTNDAHHLGRACIRIDTSFRGNITIIRMPRNLIFTYSSL